MSTMNKLKWNFNLNTIQKNVFEKFACKMVAIFWRPQCVNSMISNPCGILSSLIHYSDVIMGAVASQITSLMIVYSIVYSGRDQRKHQSSASLAFVRGIHRWPVNSPHKGPVTRKMFPCDDIIMTKCTIMDYPGLDVCCTNPATHRRLFPGSSPVHQKHGWLHDDCAAHSRPTYLEDQLPRDWGSIEKLKLNWS